MLRPGGRFAVSDVVVRGEVPEAVRRSVELWIGCVAGALEETEYRRLLAEVGFEDDRGRADADLPRRGRPRSSSRGWGSIPPRVAAQVDGKFMSAFVRARKP